MPRVNAMNRAIHVTTSIGAGSDSQSPGTVSLDPANEPLDDPSPLQRSSSSSRSSRAQNTEKPRGDGKSKHRHEVVSGIEFDHVSNGLRHSIGISNGLAYSWGRTNALGQLGRPTSSKAEMRKPNHVHIQLFGHNQTPFSSKPNANASHRTPPFVKAFVGGFSDSGHSALLDSNGMLWMAGCDRWQQLGLGSPKGGSSGYTWIDGKLWQEAFRPAAHLLQLMKEDVDSRSPKQGNTTRTQPAPPLHLVRDVSLGGDHTLVLSTNRRDVYAFGKGGEGQIGLKTKPFVSAPVRSTALSLGAGASSIDQSSTKPQGMQHRQATKLIAAVCAVESCSMTLDESGAVLTKAGKCRALNRKVAEGLRRCLIRAKNHGLLSQTSSS